MQKNLRIVMVNGQAILVENVLDYKIDSLGVQVTWGDESEELKDGKVIKKVAEKKDWFNTIAVMAVKEEFKK